MSVETPARIAILGAGPIGLEAALYARCLGYDVDLYERGRAAEHLRQWGHVRMFTPAAANISTLGLAALGAQETGWKPPPPDAFLTGRELAELYYLPLAQSDLLADSLHEQTEVLAVGRGNLLKGELQGEERAAADFNIFVRTGAGEAQGGQPAGQRIVAADVVIDATGTFGQHNWLGPGGIPAIGESAAQSRIDYGLPDILGRDRELYAHRHTLVIGSGHAAAHNISALDKLGRDAPYTRVTWVVRHDDDDSSGPIRLLADDPWPQRDALTREANRLARSEGGHLSYCPASFVEQVLWQEGLDHFEVRLGGRHAGQIEFDRIIANVGHRPDSRLYAELQVAEEPVWGAAVRWGLPPAAELLAFEDSSPSAPRPEELLTSEPDFYVLGAKSFGRNSRFTIPLGLEQIKQLFTILGDRPGLDLYGSLEQRQAK